MARESRSILEALLAEVLMADLAPCDLGSGVEVVHDVEAIEIEMECALDDDPVEVSEPDPGDTLVDHPAFDHPAFDHLVFDEPLVATTQFIRVGDDIGTHQFVRESAPYERIEIQLDARAFRLATIEEAMAGERDRRNSQSAGLRQR